MANSSPEGIELGKGSKLESLSLSINKEKVLEIKKQERSYSEEDLRNAFFSFPDEWVCFEEWFEQFKKK